MPHKIVAERAGRDFVEQVWRWRLDGVVFGEGAPREYRLLGNMVTCPLMVGTTRILSAESAYQAAKFAHKPQIQLEVLSAPGHSAKALARKWDTEIGTDWPILKRRAMLASLTLKFSGSREARLTLAQTGRSPIVELSRRDDYWGAISTEGFACGANMLGRLLMSIRLMNTTDKFPLLERWAHEQTAFIWPVLRSDDDDPSRWGQQE